MTLRESAVSPNGEDGLKWHSPSPQICAEKLLLKLLHHQGAEGKYSACMAQKQALWFYSLDSFLDKIWSKCIHWCSHPLTSAVSNVKYLLLAINAHLFKASLVFWADRVAGKTVIKSLWIFFCCCCFLPTLTRGFKFLQLR